MTEGRALTEWLSATRAQSADGMYRHTKLAQSSNQLGALAAPDALCAYIRRAHEDARQHFRRLAEISLDPLDTLTLSDPTEGYPGMLPMQTLKGYFGEVFAGLIAEYFAPFGVDNWKVPAFLFRFHDDAFDRLERLRQSGGDPERSVIGRRGDDCLAFQLNDEGNIVRWLACEAKCTAGHDSEMINDAHRKISETNVVPISIRQLIDILTDRGDDEENVRWIAALRQLWWKPRSVNAERHDLICYVCGQRPVAPSWMSPNTVNSHYVGSRKLEAVEVHLDNVDDLVHSVYRKAM